VTTDQQKKQKQVEDGRPLTAKAEKTVPEEE
jgi:hypothetical protein